MQAACDYADKTHPEALQFKEGELLHLFTGNNLHVHEWSLYMRHYTSQLLLHFQIYYQETMCGCWVLLQMARQGLYPPIMCTSHTDFSCNSYIVVLCSLIHSCYYFAFLHLHNYIYTDGYITCSSVVPCSRSLQ